MKRAEEAPAQLFEVSGSEAFFQSAADLLDRFSQVDTTVPKRTQGRKSWHRERSCVVRYLSVLALNSCLQFPLRIVKWESPDFFLHSPGRVIGLEITEAGTKRGQEAMTRHEKSPPGSALEGEAIVRLPGQPLQGRGHLRGEAERELCRLVIHALSEKTAKLNEPHFEAADHYELLVYDNSHVVSLASMKDMVVLLKRAQSNWQPGPEAVRRFSRASLMRESQILYDCFGEATIFGTHVQ